MKYLKILIATNAIAAALFVAYLLTSKKANNYNNFFINKQTTEKYSVDGFVVIDLTKEKEQQ